MAQESHNIPQGNHGLTREKALPADVVDRIQQIVSFVTKQHILPYFQYHETLVHHQIHEAIEQVILLPVPCNSGVDTMELGLADAVTLYDAGLFRQRFPFA